MNKMYSDPSTFVSSVVNHSFYQDFPILKESNVDSKSFRLCLSSLTARVLKNGMEILGIELPSRM